MTARARAAPPGRVRAGLEPQSRHVHAVGTAARSALDFGEQLEAHYQLPPGLVRGQPAPRLGGIVDAPALEVRLPHGELHGRIRVEPGESASLQYTIHLHSQMSA